MINVSPGARKAIIALLYTFLLLMFLAAPFRNLHPLVKEFHKVYGFAVLCTLVLLHLISVQKTFITRLKKKNKTPIEKLKTGSGIGLGIMMILMIASAYTRKMWVIITSNGHKWEPIREFHTFYGPMIFSTVLVLHVYAMTRIANQQDPSKLGVRKDYKGFFPIFLISLLVVLGIAMSRIFFQNIARRLEG